MLADPIEKIFKLNDLKVVIQGLKSENKKIAFTNGCFDIIHTGHTRYLKAARDTGDILVVGVNSDRSVRGLKGDKRPIVPLEERMEVLAGLYFVDFVVPFDEPDPYRVISILKPTLLIKGGDWPIDQIIGKDVVLNEGGQVFTIPVVPGRSTSTIIDKIVGIHSQKP